jgi:hypothetical protein
MEISWDLPSTVGIFGEMGLDLPSGVIKCGMLENIQIVVQNLVVPKWKISKISDGVYPLVSSKF